MAIDLPRGGRWLLEIRRLVPRDGEWDRLAARFGLPARVPLDPPRFGADVVERRFYWDVECRPDEWLFGAPSSWTSQQRWRWSGLLPERTPAVSWRALSAWVQAAGTTNPGETAEPETVGRRVVYSGVGRPGGAAIWLLPFWFLVLVCSGAALAAGLACLGRAALRRPAPLLALAGATVLAAAAAPDVAVLAATAAVPGVTLALLAWILERMTGGAAGGRIPPATVQASASSMTRAARSSLVIAGSAVRGDSTTGSGRLPS